MEKLLFCSGFIVTLICAMPAVYEVLYFRGWARGNRLLWQAFIIDLAGTAVFVLTEVLALALLMKFHLDTVPVRGIGVPIVSSIVTTLLTVILVLFLLRRKAESEKRPNILLTSVLVCVFIVPIAIGGTIATIALDFKYFPVIETYD